MAKPTKKYRLMHGTHSVPNPDFKEGDEPMRSHYNVEAGALVDLNDDQYAAFSDKFEPAESAASDVKSAEDAKFTSAKAQAAKTGQTTNPNV